MKKRVMRTLIWGAVSFGGLGLAMFTLPVVPGQAELAAQEINGHLVWDYIDKVNWCLGSPINCNFNFM